MQKIKEGKVNGDLFYYLDKRTIDRDIFYLLEAVNNFVCLLQVYGELRSGGVKLGGFNV